MGDVYVCRNRGCKSQLRCLGLAVLDDEDLHEHETDENFLLISECLEGMKKRCFESLDPIPQIYEEELAELAMKCPDAAAEFKPYE